MRDLETGAASCCPSSSTSNPLVALANAIVGSSSKTQERLEEIPTSIPTSSYAPFYAESADHLRALDQPFTQPVAQGSEFAKGFNAVHQSGFTDAWDEIQHPQVQGVQGPFIGHGGGGSLQLQPVLDGPPQRVLSNFSHSFVDSSHGGIPLHPTPLPPLGLSEADKQCIHDRSSIMARHFFADKSEDFINAQVNSLLHSLDIDSHARGRGTMPGRCREVLGYWNAPQGMMQPNAHATDGWVTEFNQHRAQLGDPDEWARSFEQQHGANGWASEFTQEQFHLVSQIKCVNIPTLAAMEQTRMLPHTLAQNDDPRVQNSKFLQFVSKMTRGELVIDDNQVKLVASGDWAT